MDQVALRRRELDAVGTRLANAGGCVYVACDGDLDLLLGHGAPGVRIPEAEVESVRGAEPVSCVREQAAVGDVARIADLDKVLAVVRPAPYSRQEPSQLPHVATGGNRGISGRRQPILIDMKGRGYHAADAALGEPPLEVLPDFGDGPVNVAVLSADRGPQDSIVQHDTVDGQRLENTIRHTAHRSVPTFETGSIN